LGRELKIDLRSDGTMDLELLGGMFPVARGSRVQARLDRFGHLLVWPDSKTYRVLPQGSLPALLREGRVDVVPLVHGDLDDPTDKPVGARFGLPLLRTTLKANRGSVALDFVENDDYGSAGVPLCRMLLELLAIAPHPSVCINNRVIVSAKYQLSDAALEFEVTTFKRSKAESLPTALVVPPKQARFVPRGLPFPKPPLDSDQLTSLRKTEEFGVLQITNSADLAGWLLLDGNPIAFVTPRTRQDVEGLPRGDYHLELRDFFGAALLPPGPIKIEELTRVGRIPDADAGAPEAPQPPNSER
jgi:hypothetical protein